MDTAYLPDCNECKKLEAELARVRELCEALKQQAEIHALEASTQRATVREIYQLVSDGKGEPGDWNGARPVRDFIERERTDKERLARRAVHIALDADSACDCDACIGAWVSEAIREAGA